MNRKNITTAVILSVFFGLAIASSSDKNKNGSDESDSNKSEKEKTASYLDTLPDSEIALINLEMKYDTLFDNSDNDLQRSVAQDNKKNDQKKLFAGPGFNGLAIENWRGEVEEVLSINGKAGLKVKCPSNGEDDLFWGGFRLTSEPATDEEIYLGKGPIAKNSPVFNEILNLKRGDIIEFSGNFYKSFFSNLFLYSCSEYYNTQNQEYLFKFDKIKKLTSK